MTFGVGNDGAGMVDDELATVFLCLGVPAMLTCGGLRIRHHHG